MPALAAFAIFRNRIDELIAEASLLAEQVFADFKRGTSRAARRRESQRRQRSADAGVPSAIPSIDPDTQV